MKRAFITLSTLLLLSACGYHIAGLNLSTPIRFYIDVVESVEADSAYRDIVQKAVERYLVDYSELSSYKRATYILNMKLTSVRLTDSTLNAFNEATTTNIEFTLLLIVKDLEGKEVFSYTINTNRTYAINQNIARTKLSEKQAIETALQNSLADFRIAFTNRAYALDLQKKKEMDRYIPILENKALLISLNEKLDKEEKNTLIEAYKNKFFSSDNSSEIKERQRMSLDFSK